MHDVSTINGKKVRLNAATRFAQRPSYQQSPSGSLPSSNQYSFVVAETTISAILYLHLLFFPFLFFFQITNIYFPSFPLFILESSSYALSQFL
jgi:hypothetical protein